jgi:hypothetical protein
MENKIFDNPVLSIHHDEDKNYMTVRWKPGCGNILSDRHAAGADIIRSKIMDKSPVRLMVDMSACSYGITPETGPWYKNPLFSMYGDLPRGKFAIVLPHNLAMHASFDAVTAHENLDLKTKIQYFKDRDQANDWLEKS